MIVTPAARATIGLGLTQIVGWGTTFLVALVATVMLVRVSGTIR